MPKLTYTASQLMLSFLLFFSLTNAQIGRSQCTAGTQAQLVSCLSSLPISGGSITLTATIALSSDLAMPNKSFTLYTAGFDLLTMGMVISSTGTPTLTVSNVGGVLTILKNGTGPTFLGLTGNGSLLDYAASFNVTLAAEMTAFTAKTLNKTVVLTWQTVSEKNLAYFDIERRRADGDSFETVEGNATPSMYHFTDNKPINTNYYRLRQVDKDGKEVLSKIVTQSVTAQQTLKIYPNIVSESLNIATESLQIGEETADFQIMNIFGQVVLQGQVGAHIDVAFLQRGIYIFKIGEAQAKFIKQ
jgi:hypothetical protein